LDAFNYTVSDAETLLKKVTQDLVPSVFAVQRPEVILLAVVEG